jgi:hypothetical protein
MMTTINPDCNPFAKPNGAVICDINTSAAYLKTYDALIKNVEEDMLLPCILAIDKTTCNVGGGGRLLLEPIVVSSGLMKHDMKHHMQCVSLGSSTLPQFFCAAVNH